MYAPARGDTFERFVKLAEDRFETSVEDKYDQHVWDLHCKVSDRGATIYPYTCKVSDIIQGFS